MAGLFGKLASAAASATAAGAVSRRGIEFPALGQIAFVDLGPPPTPGPGQLLLATRYSAITNGTERHALLQEHGYGTFPGRHGYQHVVRVAAVGEGVTGWQVGATAFCGDYVGHRGWHLVDQGNPLLYPLRGELPSEDAALFGVAGVALRAVRRTRVGVGDRVWVVGLGPIGQFTAQCAAAAGADVVASDLLAERLERARQAGIDEVLDAGDTEHTARLRERGPFTHILDTSGRPDLLTYLHESRVMQLGTVIGLIAVRGEVRFPWTMLHGTQASIEVSCHFGPDDLRVLARLAAGGKVRIPPVVSHRAPIAEALGVYATLRDRPGDLLGVIFDWTDESGEALP